MEKQKKTANLKNSISKTAITETDNSRFPGPVTEDFKTSDIKDPLLYICATPIGNLSDASFRLIDTLKSAGYIIAEDTRTIRKIFARYGISKNPESITGYQDYSSNAKIDHIISKIRQSGISCLVSESGMPLIQDPGYKIIRRCIKEGLKISVIPGPNAALSALVLSGLAPDNFLFAGFLPKTASKRREKLLELAYLSYTMVFYESPLRVSGLLHEMLKVFGNRQACIARELTKLYEEVRRGNLAELIDYADASNLKGEAVVVVEGYKNEPIKDFSQADIRKEYLKLSAQNIPRKDAFKIIQSRYDIDRQTLYNIAIGKT